MDHLEMRWVVFLRAVNVGKANRCQPAVIAKQLSKLGVINIGAVGTFVVRENVSESALRSAIAKKLPFKCEIMICRARDIIKLASTDPFAQHPSGPDITRFVNVLAKPLRKIRCRSPETSNIQSADGRISRGGNQTSEFPSLPLCLPSAEDWVIKVIAIEKQFVLGVYRREMKAISYLGKVEKLLGVPSTNRNWNTIQKVAKILEMNG